MPTENKAVTAYLPPDLEELLARYCAESDLIRKDRTGSIKPALGTGIVEILRLFFSQEELPPPLELNEGPSRRLSRNEIKAVAKEVLNAAGFQDNLSFKEVVTQEKLEAALDDLKAEFLGK